MRFEIYSSPEHQQYGNSITYTGRYLWYWRLRAGNGKIIGDGSESYASKANVRRALNRLSGVIIKTQHQLPIVEVEA